MSVTTIEVSGSLSGLYAKASFDNKMSDMQKSRLNKNWEELSDGSLIIDWCGE